MYFYGELPLNADIDRHRLEQKKLEEKLAELESQEMTKMNVRMIRTYRNFLCQLQQSKAEVVSKLGKK